MTEAELAALKHASNVARASMMCHQQLLVLLVAKHPDGAEICAQFEEMSRDGIAQLEVQAPADFVEAYKLARQGLLFNLDEVMAQLDSSKAAPH